MPLQHVLFVLLCGSLIKGTDAVKSKYACQNEKLRLRCEKPFVIRIYAAHYGRLEPGTNICPHHNISSLTCRASDVLLKVTGRCANKLKCAVKADKTMFGDPCPGTYKYLDVIYGCVPGYFWTPTPRVRKTTKRPKHNQNLTTLSTVKFTTWKTTVTSSTTIRTTASTLPTIQNSSRPTRNTTARLNSTGTRPPDGETSFSSSNGRVLTTHTSTSPPKDPETGFSGKKGEEGQAFIALLTSLYLTCRFIEERPQYTLVVFLSAVAGATAFLLMLLLGVHLCKRRRKKRKFSMEDTKEEEPLEPNKQKTVTIEIQGSDDETKEINVNPGDIIIIDHNDVNRPGSEDLGYLSEIVRFYNSQNIESDDQISIIKQSSTCDSPSVISTETSENERRDSKYDSGIKHCTCQNSEQLRPSSPICLM